jgi:hypothetical protein
MTMVGDVEPFVPKELSGTPLGLYRDTIKGK